MLTQLRGEKVLWAGRPDLAVWFGRADLYLVPFTLVWAGFTVFWNVMAWEGHAPVFFRIWGVPFLVVGIYVVVGRFYVKRNQKQRLEYALTADRAIVCDGGVGVRDVPLAYVPIDQNRSRNGRHLTVTFGDSLASRRGFGFGGRPMPANTGLDVFGFRSTAPTFVDVGDVVGLEAALARINRR
ncbi:MAG: hypothetical protein M3Y35_12250 [Actinomycetota bacterium]|nr:hypothetical protein [Actinomycetota bacterium]